MKNRYFGDIYDYVKYSLLRSLVSPTGKSAVICWMLTEDRGGDYGGHTSYLKQRERWGSFDPTVYGFLHRQVVQRNSRHVGLMKGSGILRNCRFYSETLPDDHVRRQRYFRRFLRFARGAPLVFFDPDNGVEVKSVRYGAKNSSKYIYMAELKDVIRAGHSVLIYQHLPPQPRRLFYSRMSRMLLRVAPAGFIWAIHTKKVAFFLLPQPGTVRRFRKSLTTVETAWGGVLGVSERRR